MASEFDIIDGIARRFDTPDGVSLGIGDDAAVLEDGRFNLVTTDMLVEEVHFRSDWCSPADIGWRALTASLSDIAAMGGRCGPYVANVAMTSEEQGFVDGILDGLEFAAEMAGSAASTVPIGGDLTGSPGPSVVSITLLGESLANGPILRSGAIPGDHIVVTGQPGRAAAGLAILQETLELEGGLDGEPLVDAYRRPAARCDIGGLLGETVGAHSLIDVSDGLRADLGHILDASGVGARLDWQALPLDDALAELPLTDDELRRDYVLRGGEDFELLMTLDDVQWSELKALELDVGLHRIGTVLPDEGVVEWTGLPAGIEPGSRGGWDHFRPRSG